jgi:hypothetical protein
MHRSREGILPSRVTIMQQIDCNPQFGLRDCMRWREEIYFFASFAI